VRASIRFISAPLHPEDLSRLRERNRHHTSATTLSCPKTAAINCLKVTTSSYSSFLGMPVSDLGLAFFTVMTALCLPVPWRSSASLLRVVRLAAAAASVFVLYLAWAELYKIDAICLWCTAVHVITAALFGVFAGVGRSGGKERGAHALKVGRQREVSFLPLGGARCGPCRARRPRTGAGPGGGGAGAIA
jgi:uncharacterized membrane protein